MHFIDLFAGCGGLSLGLTKAGWRGLFAVEKNSDAFHTFKHNLIDQDIVTPFDWPEWLPCKAMTTSELIQNHKTQLKNLRGQVRLIVGGPPCQGFSLAGQRNHKDPRNRLTDEYIKIVEHIQPRLVLLENVRGFNTAFRQNGKNEKKVYAQIVKEKLEKLGYAVHCQMCDASMFGVPQSRPRFIMIARRKSIDVKESPFEILKSILPDFRLSKGLTKFKNTSVKQAISDLEIGKDNVSQSIDTNNFMQIARSRGKLTKFQKLMRQNCSRGHVPNSLRLARHNNETLNRFTNVLRYFAKGKSLTKEELLLLGTKKQYFTPLHPDMVSRTITTLPDDFLHYSEPRILTVRENARIQSFPDWFEFLGKYTTGGDRRKDECPRYSQVGNAVPPLMAEALGIVMLQSECGLEDHNEKTRTA